MQQLYNDIDGAVLLAVTGLYRDNDRITLQDSRINDEEVPWHVYTAICERIKYNANLQGKRGKPGGQSQILLSIDGKSKKFAACVLNEGGLALSVQPEGRVANPR